MGYKKSGVFCEGSDATKKLVPRLSFPAQLCTHKPHVYVRPPLFVLHYLRNFLVIFTPNSGSSYPINMRIRIQG